MCKIYNCLAINEISNYKNIKKLVFGKLYFILQCTIVFNSTKVERRKKHLTF